MRKLSGVGAALGVAFDDPEHALRPASGDAARDRRNDAAGLHRYSRSRSAMPRRAANAAAIPVSNMSQLTGTSQRGGVVDRRRKLGRRCVSAAADAVSNFWNATLASAGPGRGLHGRVVVAAVVEGPHLRVLADVRVERAEAAGGGRAGSGASGVERVLHGGREALERVLVGAARTAAIKVRLSSLLASKPSMRAVASGDGVGVRSGTRVADLVVGEPEERDADDSSEQHEQRRDDERAVEDPTRLEVQPDLA